MWGHLSYRVTHYPFVTISGWYITADPDQKLARLQAWMGSLPFFYYQKQFNNG